MADIRVMIVDDERIFREALAGQIDWQALGMQVVCAAQHALEAIQYIRDNPVDVVLTDVRMPVMDGLAMIEEMQAMGKNPVFVLLTGYGEFEYAQRAIRIGVRDYLLKPADEETIVGLMQKICAELAQRELEQKTTEVDRSLETVAAGAGGKTIPQILQIIDEELGNEQLSLKWISQNRLFLNENYLSKLFQKEVGKRFSAYLLDKRMQLAMFLLAAPEETAVTNVATATGFGGNAGYFSSVFKKYTGYTPSGYRKMFH